LASKANLTDPSVWISQTDILRAENPTKLTSVFDSEFHTIPLAVTVVLLPKITTMPTNMPIAWTRGLKPDGNWSETSPYGGQFGYVMFVGGNIERFERINNNFRVWGTDKPTSNIREALPPGTRIGEYQPTEDDLRRAGPRLAEMRRKENEQRLAVHLAWLAGTAFTAVTGWLWWRARRPEKIQAA
jgi:hypothetical protein